MAAPTDRNFTLVTRKPCFGLPTACPDCLPVYVYLKFAQIPFQLDFSLNNPDSDQVPYVESGEYVAFNNEKGGVIESLKEDGIVDLDSGLRSVPDFMAMKAMISSWLEDAVLYDLWVGSDESAAHKIYYSDLPWPLGKILYMKQVYTVKQRLGITKGNAERMETEIYRRAAIAYGALSTRLGEDDFFFSRPSSLDAAFVAHAMFVLQALPEASLLRTRLLGYENIVRYVERHRSEVLENYSSVLENYSSSTATEIPSATSSSTSKPNPSNSSSSPRNKTKKERTPEEKTFRRRAKYFLISQLLAVLFFLTVMGGTNADGDMDDDDEGIDYED